MTLNITVVTSKRIFQCADYRLTYSRSGRFSDFTTQKIHLATGQDWNASICFSGVGSTDTLDVATWLADLISSIECDTPFETLISKILTADAWLADVPLQNRRHSFSIGAFIGHLPRFVLLSNWETLNGPRLREPLGQLQAYSMCPHKPVTFVSGQWHEIRSWEKRQLANRVEQGADSNAIFTRLVEINRSIALRNPAVSSTCFTTFVDHLGTSTGRANGESGTVGVPLSAFPSLLRDLVNDGAIKPIKGQSLRIIQTSVTRVTASEEYHKAQVVHCPGNADAYSNYGAYLFASSGDVERAEELYLKALSINPFHTNALANLALLRWRGQLYDEAERLFQIALTRRDETGNAEAGVENVCWGYSHFLASEKDNLVAALKTADCGIRDFPHSSRLVAWRAHLLLLQRRAAEALSEFQRARELGATASETEPSYAIALQLSGASRSECLAAYQGARKIAPANTAVLLNLAQLLFAEGDATQASRYLRDALNLQLDFSAEMEAQFYLLAHTTVESGGVFRRLKELLAHGARMDWDVSPNIEAVSRSCPQKAACLAEISLILRGLQGQESLTTLEARMKRM